MSVAEQIVTITFTFPVGAINHSHKGLIHFFEHYLLKAKYIGEDSLLSRLDTIGINVNAATSTHHLRVFLQTSNRYLMQVVQIFFERLNYLNETTSLDQVFIRTEKEVIFREMEVSAARDKSETENKILGNSRSVSSITEGHISTVGRIFSQLMPVIEIVNGHFSLEETKTIESVLKTKRLVIKNERLKPHFYDKHLETKAMEESLVGVFLTEPLIRVANQSDTVDEKLIEQIVRKQLVLTSSKKEAIHYVRECQEYGLQAVIVKGSRRENKNEHIGAVSFKLDDVLRNHRHSVQHVLKQYLFEQQDKVGSFRIFSETGVLTIIFEGTEDQVVQGITRIITFDEKFLFNELVQVTKKQTFGKLQMLNDYALGSIFEIARLDFDKKKIIYCLKKALLDIAVVTTLENIEEIQKVKRKAGSGKFLDNKTDYIGLFRSMSNRERDHSDSHEYLQFFSGPDYFSTEKFISHVAWQIIDGVSGRLSKQFSTDQINFYSFKYFPRELVDGGYLVLYVFDKNKGIDIAEKFNSLIRNLLFSLSEKEFQTAKMKLLMAKQYSETVESQILNISLYSLYRHKYISYEDGIQAVSYDSVKAFFQGLLNAKTVTV